MVKDAGLVVPAPNGHEANSPLQASGHSRKLIAMERLTAAGMLSQRVIGQRTTTRAPAECEKGMNPTSKSMMTASRIAVGAIFFKAAPPWDIPGDFRSPNCIGFSLVANNTLPNLNN